MFAFYSRHTVVGYSTCHLHVCKKQTLLLKCPRRKSGIFNDWMKQNKAICGIINCDSFSHLCIREYFIFHTADKISSFDRFWILNTSKNFVHMCTCLRYVHTLSSVDLKWPLTFRYHYHCCTVITKVDPRTLFEVHAIFWRDQVYKVFKLSPLLTSNDLTSNDL